MLYVLGWTLLVFPLLKKGKVKKFLIKISFLLRLT